MALRAVCSWLSPATKFSTIVGRSMVRPDFSAEISRVLANFQIVREMSLRRNKPYRHWIKPEREPADERLIEDNVEFLQTMVKETYKSPLKEPPPERSQWTPRTYRSGVICKKIGVVPQWTSQGKRILATMLQVVDNHVISSSTPEQFLLQYRANNYSVEKRRLGCMVVGAESIDPTNLTDDYVKLFEPSGLQPKRKLTKFIVTENALLQPGTPLRASHFRVGDYVDIGGKTFDHGFQGVMKRWGFKGGPATHGATKFHRRPGSIGFSRKGKVRKGKKMPGHMGNQYRCHRGLKILRINHKYDVIYVKGPAVMGPTGAWIYVWDTRLPTRRAYKNPPPMPTHYPEDEQTPLPEDVVHPDLFQFNQPTIVFEVTEEDLKQKRVGAKTALKAPAKAAVKPAAAKSTTKS